MEKNKREGQKRFFGGLSLSLSFFERLNKSSPRWAWFCRTVSSVIVSYNLDVLSHIFVHGNHLGDYTKNFQPENPERVRWNGTKRDNHLLFGLTSGLCPVSNFNFFFFLT